MEINWTGKSGKVYRFALEQIVADFEDLPGVYILCKPSAGEGWDGVHIGVTESFSRSITDQAATLIDRHNATHAAIWPVSDIALAYDALADLTPD